MAEYFEKEKLCDWCLQTGPSYCDICVMNRHDLPAADVRPVVYCQDCRHRDPEDHKCDCGEMERQGCLFKVADDYFCAYGER